MKYEDFARNLRGVNGGKNFEPAYLQAIFDTIKNNEIILPEEHDNKHAFDYAWRELLLKTMSAGDLVICDTNIYDADMFAATWKPIIATLSYVFLSATDDAVFSRVIAGFDQCARIAAKYGLTEALDHIVRCLSTISTLSTETPPSTALNTEIQVNSNSVMVSELAVKFGRDFKAQLATVVLFRVVTSNEKVLREGWKQVCQFGIRCYSPLSNYDIDCPYMAKSICELLDSAILFPVREWIGYSLNSITNAFCRHRKKSDFKGSWPLLSAFLISF